MSNFSWTALLMRPAFLFALLLLPTGAIATEVSVDTVTNSQSATAPDAETVVLAELAAPAVEQTIAIDPVASSPLPAGPSVATLAQAAPAGMAQVTSVSQLSDVQPTDWAFQALQSLVERYGCIVGYPDGTYRGNRALTRYEFAAGLNACMDRVNELIAAGIADLVTREDLATLQRLQEEFAAELATLRGRVDALEARTAELEANQFSTTTKLVGEAIFAISDAFTDTPDAETVFQDRVRLNLLTSFTGRDRLRTRLQAGNAVPLLTRGGINEGRFTYDDPNPATNNNSIFLDVLDYRFPVGNKLNVNVFANGGLHHFYADTVNPYLEGFGGGSGALSRFGERNPIYRIGPFGAGVGLNYRFSNALKLDLGYLANEASNPNAGAGLFNGNYSTLAQVVFQPASRLKLAATYVHAYDGSLPGNAFNFGGTGTTLANRPWQAFGVNTPVPISSNSYGLEASFQLSPNIVIGGWAGLTKARLINLGDADIWNYAVTLAFPDLGKQGNLAGIIVGAEPSLKGRRGGLVQAPFTRDDAIHVEAFYKYQLTDNISITPGVIWLTAPNQNTANDDIVIGTLRTTFTF